MCEFNKPWIKDDKFIVNLCFVELDRTEVFSGGQVSRSPLSCSDVVMVNPRSQISENLNLFFCHHLDGR